MKLRLENDLKLSVLSWIDKDRNNRSGEIYLIREIPICSYRTFGH